VALICTNARPNSMGVTRMISETREEPEVLSFSEAAEFLKVSVRTLRRWVAEKRVPHAKIGGLVRFRRQALLDWLAEEERQTMEAGERARRVREARGALAHLPGGVDEFLQRKHEEIDLEDAAARIQAALEGRARMTPEERADKVREAMEIFAQIPASGEGFSRRKQEEIDLEDRAARIRAARGSLAHLAGSLDEFLQRKQEDIDLEDRRTAPPSG
jgi:excisionase family DNA binding protein